MEARDDLKSHKAHVLNARVNSGELTEREQHGHDVHEVGLELLHDAAGDEHEHAHNSEHTGGDGDVQVGGLAVVAETLENVAGGGARVGVVGDDGAIR
eukprot:8539334-Pyramimonas_sp.AAC.2